MPDTQRPARRSVVLIGFVLFVLTVWVWWLALQPLPPCLRVTFLDVGQGDAIVLQTPKGHVMVVDTGRATPEDDMGRRVVLPFLRAQGVNRVDALVLTHPDIDHIGGAISLLQRITVRYLLLPPSTSDDPLYRHIQEAAERRRIPVRTLARGERIEFSDGVAAEVLHPSVRSAFEQHPDNNASLVLRLRYGRTSLLLTGDTEEEAERDMLRAGENVRADVLKLGHHGSLTSSSESFLEAVRPQVAIVSAGRGNVYGHPHPEILARLEARHIRLFRTDRNGAITIVSDGREMKIATARVPDRR
jgi:competence protein ComEC